MLDLKAQFASIGDEVKAAVARVFEHQQFILGPEVAELERRIAAYCQSRFAIACGSGTDALLLALRALDIGAGDEVLTTPFTFFATAGAISNVGARPVFVDIDPRTFLIDPAQLAATLARHRHAKAIIPVHLYGACADMDAIAEVAARFGVPVIEDAAQAIGAEHNHRRAGSIGAIGCFSFFPSKNLGGAGEGGIMTTNDERLAARLAALRVHGSRETYVHEEVGTNSRLDTLQAAILLAKLDHLDRWTEARQANARLYCEILAPLGLPILLPETAANTTRHVFNQFVIRAQRRDALRQSLASAGIGSAIYYPIPLHAQQCFASLGYPARGCFPVSEAASLDVLALPIHPDLSEDDIRYVCQNVKTFYDAA